MSALKASNRKEIYENYVTDALKYVINNTAQQEQRFVMNTSYREIIHPVTKEVEEDNDKKANDIISNIKNKLGGK